MKKVIIISGSPRKANSLFCANKVAEEIISFDNSISTEVIDLSDKKINHCIACGNCSNNNPCFQKDDVSDILKKMGSADAIIVVSPTYFGGISSQLSALFARSVLLRRHGMKLKNKICGAIAIGNSRNGGQEKVCDNIHTWALIQEMIIVGDSETAHFGGILLGSHNSSELGSSKDEQGMKTLKNLAKRIVDLLSMLKE